MFVDELQIEAKAGNGGDGVVRWRHEKFKPKAGPAGGNGGNGGDVYVRAINDANRLSKYTGRPRFAAENGADGSGLSQHGANGADYVIEIPIGSTVTDVDRGRTFSLLTVGETVRILKGGSGGLGNERFKSSTNTSPEESTAGRPGEQGIFNIEVALAVDVGLVGLPNAGKSTLLNALTNAHSRIGAYPFTTTEPHLGALGDGIIADIPGLIEGAATGKGLGHKFLRHVSRTKMLLHLVSLGEEDPVQNYYTIRTELESFDKTLLQKDEWIILTKKDLVDNTYSEKVAHELAKNEKRVFILDQNDADAVAALQQSLVEHLREA